MARILIVDDEPSLRWILATLLQEDHHTVLQASGVKEAKETLASTPLDLIITDQRMRDGEGLSLLADSKEIDPALPVVLITAYATVELAVEAMRRGAFDFITKPFMPESVRAVVKRACERTELLRENERLRGEVQRLGKDEGFVGVSPAILRVMEQVDRVAPTNATVLITGETGTGKEVVARALHNRSARASKPFVAVNCAGLPETLLESELFGHERGAFTGADRPRKGLFEAAHSGTLFLDEAGEMPLSLQVKLLRVLMDGVITRVGASVSRTVDVRVLVATHRDLPQRVKEGTFREDLYYRIAVIPLHIPPLRERREDIPLLVQHFLKRTTREMNTPTRAISEPAMRKLARYTFPGNVRELRNLVERACILSMGDEITPEDFPIAVSDRGDEPEISGETRKLLDCVGTRLQEGTVSIDLRSELEAIERELIQRALESAQGVQAEAARRLGLSRSDLAYKLKKYQMAKTNG